MQWTALLIMAVITLSTAVYAQLRLPQLAASRPQASIARAVLVLVGLGFGWAMSAKAGPDAGVAMQTVVFVAAFGLVHTPAAIILLLKTWQRGDRPGG